MIDDISCTFVTIKKRNSCMFLFLSKETFTQVFFMVHTTIVYGLLLCN